jgi:membrane peptidoglycan carboxypeptidase
MVLGTSALTLMDLTTGYATFAAGGKLARPYAVLEIHRPNGDLIYNRSTNAVDAPQVVPVEAIADLNVMLKEVVKSGTAKKSDLGFAPQGGKTGTNQSYRDAWYIGFTAHNVTGVWVGNDDFTPMNKVTGGMIPAPTWKRIMEVAEQGLTPEGLAGIPLDETYTQVAAAVLGPNAAAVPGPDGSSLPIEAPISPEADLVAEDGANAEAKDILNGMFDLFQNTNATSSRQPARKRPQLMNVSNSRPLVLPKANVTAKRKKLGFLDRVLRKKKSGRTRHRTIFGY